VVRLDCCKDCTERYPACGDYCERAAKARKQAEAIKEARRMFYIASPRINLRANSTSNNSKIVCKGR